MKGAELLTLESASELLKGKDTPLLGSGGFFPLQPLSFPAPFRGSAPKNPVSKKLVDLSSLLQINPRKLFPYCIQFSVLAWGHAFFGQKDAVEGGDALKAGKHGYFCERQCFVRQQRDGFFNSYKVKPF